MTVHVDRYGDVLQLRLDNPGRGNALSPEMADRLAEVFAGPATDDGMVAVVITGTGRSFCAGADVRASAALGDPGLRLDFLDSARQMVQAITQAPVPVIAAVNGPALAGGLEIVLACDVVIAAESAQFGDLHLTHGRIPGWGGATRLTRRCGPVRATELLLLGTRWDARTAHVNGLITEVVADAELAAAVERIAGTLRQPDRTVLRQMIALIRDVGGRLPAEALTVEWSHFAEHFGVPDPGVVDL